ncbi:MAG: GPP34 family phosphoprotein [Alphaproteobacteria bacterium]|nr:GPP34 family phosphoprotein [Alphaproteobacteria bacterium]
MPELTVPHALVLLELDDRTGRSRITGFSPTYALAAAFVAELEIQERLAYPRASHVVVRAGQAGSALLQQAEALLPAGPVRIDQAIGHVAAGDRALRQAVLDDLERWGAIRTDVTRVLAIPIAWRWPTVDGSIEADLVARLRQHVETAPVELPGTREDAILSLARAAGLLTAIWAEDALPAVRERLERRTRLSPIGKVVWDLTR